MSILPKPIKAFIHLNVRISETFNTLFPNNFQDQHHYELLYREVSNYTNYKVCEVGGIDRPMFKKDYFLQYDGLDLDHNNKVNLLYHNFTQGSIENANFNFKYDCIFSQFLVEHVEKKCQMFSNIYNGLEPGGKTVHFFPGGNHPFSIINSLFPNSIRQKLIHLILPSYKSFIGYKPYYNDCSYRKIKKMLLNIGYSNVEINNTKFILFEFS